MPLTTAEITALWERRKAGESTTALCTETGVCRAQLLRYWRDRGYSPASLPSSNRANAEKLRWNRKAYALHDESGGLCPNRKACDAWEGASTAILAADVGQHPWGDWKCSIQLAMEGRLRLVEPTTSCAQDGCSSRLYAFNLNAAPPAIHPDRHRLTSPGDHG